MGDVLTRLSNLEVLAETPQVIVVNKPAGQHSHPLHADEKNTTLFSIQEKYPETREAMNPRRPFEGGLVHRLDRGTSGVLICARSVLAWQKIKSRWREKSTQKIYLALVEGKCDLRCTVEAYFSHNPKSKKKMDLYTKPPRKIKSWFTKTSIETIKTTLDQSLVLVRIHTGVTHQIRATLSALGHPVVGEPVYFKKNSVKGALQKQTLDHKTKEIFKNLCDKKLFNLPLRPNPDFLPKDGFFLHAIWLRIDGIASLQDGVYAHLPKHFTGLSEL